MYECSIIYFFMRVVAFAQTDKGPSVAEAKDYSAKVGTPWLLWVDKDDRLDSLSKRLRHATKEDFDRAMQAVETGK